MTVKDIIRAWKNPAYRANLSEAELAQLQNNPAGIIDLTGTDLDFVAGGGAKACAPPKKSGGSKKSHKSSKSHKSHKSHKSSKSHKSGKC